MKRFCGGSRGPHGMGDLLKFVSFFMSFPNSSPSPVTCTCHFGQKSTPLVLILIIYKSVFMVGAVAEGFIFGVTAAAQGIVLGGLRF